MFESDESRNNTAALALLEAPRLKNARRCCNHEGMSKADDEKTKLFANALDRASTTCLALGVIAPLAAAFYEIDPVRRSDRPILIVGTLIWFAAVIALHMLARRTLDRLKP